MSFDEFKELLKTLNIDLTIDQYNRLEKYTKFLIEYNEHTNLTTIKEEKEVYLKHFYDSLTITKVIDLTKENSLLDIGTGAGFPGMVLKIMFPNLKVTLLDSNNKKTTFLKELSKILEINDVEIINDRAEELTKTRINTYDIVTARAVSNMRVLTEVSTPLVKQNGYFIALKGGNEEELNEAQRTINKLNLTVEQEENFKLPIEESKRTIIKIKKNELSDLKRLRNYSQIVKKSL